MLFLQPNLYVQLKQAQEKSKKGRSLNTFFNEHDESGDSVAWVENYDGDEDNNDDDDDDVSIMTQLRSCSA